MPLIEEKGVIIDNMKPSWSVVEKIVQKKIWQNPPFKKSASLIFNGETRFSVKYVIWYNIAHLHSDMTWASLWLNSSSHMILFLALSLYNSAIVHLNYSRKPTTQRTRDIQLLMKSSLIWFAWWWEMNGHTHFWNNGHVPPHIYFSLCWHLS